MGRNTKIQSNADLAKPHASGARVEVIQLLAHAQYGAIAYLWPRLWVIELNLAQDSFEQLQELHLEVLKLPIDSSNMRNVHDLDFLKDIYGAGGDMVSHASRAVQHLAEEMERVGKVTLQTTTAMERIKEGVVFFGLNDHGADPSYQGLVEILRIRDAVEHPRAGNIYQGDRNRWDEVPLAWMLSERGLQAYERFTSWFELIATDWARYLVEHPEPATLTVERGIESTLQAKKPTRDVVDRR